jgi:hypothetical protein
VNRIRAVAPEGGLSRRAPSKCQFRRALPLRKSQLPRAKYFYTDEFPSYRHVSAAAGQQRFRFAYVMLTPPPSTETSVMPVRPIFEKAALLAIGALLGITISYIYFAFVRSVPSSDICTTRTRKTISSIWDVDFWVAEIHCDAFSHAREVRVFVAWSGSKRRDLIFAYEPADESWLPSFGVDYKGAITVSIRGVKTVYFEDHNWDKDTIDYKIGAEQAPKSETPTPP